MKSKYYYFFFYLDHALGTLYSKILTMSLGITICAMICAYSNMSDFLSFLFLSLQLDFFPTMFFHLCNGHCEINLHWKGHIISGSKTQSYFIFRKKLLMEKPFMCLCGNVMRLSECSTLIYSQQLGERQPLTVIKYGIKIQSCREASSGIPRRDGPLSSLSRLSAFTAIRHRTWVKARAVD